MLLSYAIALIIIAGILCLPIIRKSPHTRLWRICFPLFTLFHIYATWELLGIAFRTDELYSPIMTPFLAIAVYVWCCFDIPIRLIYDLFHYCKYDLEYHIPIAIGSVLWTLALTMIIAFIYSKRKKSPQQSGPAYPPQGVGSADP